MISDTIGTTSQWNITDFINGLGGRLNGTLDQAYEMYEAKILNKFFGDQQQQAVEYSQEKYGPTQPTTWDNPAEFKIDTTVIVLGVAIVLGAVLIARK